MTSLDRLEALEKEATEGPWREEERLIVALKEKWVAEIPHYGIRRAKVDDANAALIAALRNAAPALIAVARAADNATLAYGAKNGPKIPEMEILGRLVDAFLTPEAPE